MTALGRVLPTFVVIGAMKSGTSSLAHYLRAHPEVFVTSPKEPGFFSLRWDLGLDWYESLFAGAGDARARGEASTNYTKSPFLTGVPARMASVIPDARLIYLVRHPVERIRSHYSQVAQHRNERRPIDEAVRANPDYVDFSRYAYQLGLFLEHFERDQILVVSSERLKSDRAAVLHEVFEFIGVTPDQPIDNIGREFNRGSDKRRAPEAVERARVWANRLHLAQRFPTAWRERVWKTMQVAPIATDLAVSTEQWLVAQLAEDIEAFYEIAGPTFPRWSLDVTR